VADWQISDLSGDIVATIHAGDEGLSTTSEASEYGVLSDAESVGKQRYGWLGAEQRAADAPSGIVLMGVRLYNPTTGRFLQTDPVYGGSCNAYEYTCADPVDKYDLNGKWICWSKKCALKYAAKKWKQLKKKVRKNKYVRKVWRFGKKVVKNRYVRACAGGAFGVLSVDTIKNGWKSLKKKGWRWGWGGCAGGVIMYHARKKGWW
jgi:RHS repeat-associated protein